MNDKDGIVLIMTVVGSLLLFADIFVVIFFKIKLDTVSCMTIILVDALLMAPLIQKIDDLDKKKRG